MNTSSVLMNGAVMNGAVMKGAVITGAEVSRLLRRAATLLDCYRDRFGESSLIEALSPDVVEEIPRMVQTLQELIFETNQALADQSLDCLDWQTNQGTE